jgi:hypothetical protein
MKMASKRDYAYYIKGNKIAIIERGIGSGVCSLSGYSNQTTCEAAGGTWTENAVSRDDGEWMSPIATVADGLEIQYAYSPEYFIDETDKVDAQIDTYVSLDGLLKIIDQGDNDYSASPESLSDGRYIVLKKAGRFNGLHKVKAAGVGYITLYTKFSGSATVQQAFEETIELYYNVSALVDESSTIDLPRYQANAVVYYLKAKIAEDMGDMDQREFFLREFKRQLEKSTSALKRGPYIIQGLKEIR